MLTESSRSNALNSKLDTLVAIWLSEEPLAALLLNKVAFEVAEVILLDLHCLKEEDKKH